MLSRIVLASFVVLALFASFLAGDRPILMSSDDSLYFFSELPDNSGSSSTMLRGDQLAEALGEEDWALWPLIRFDPRSVRTAGRVMVLSPPSDEHWLGTDDRGRDVASRLIHGTRTSLFLAFLCALLASVLGTVLALFASRFRWVDTALLTGCDTIAALPLLLLVLGIRGLTDASSMLALVLLIGGLRAAATARIVRDGIHGALAKPFCEAARALGCPPTRLLWRHALPQCREQLRAAAVLTASTAVLAEVALAFLGFGTGSDPSFGELLSQAQQNDMRWWLLVPAGLATTLLAWSVGELADTRKSRVG